jgi:hypothetical protein
LVAEALQLGEATALEPFGAEAIEVVCAEFAIIGLFCEQVISDFENMAADREHRPSMPYMCAQTAIARAKGGMLGAASCTTGFHQCRTPRLFRRHRLAEVDFVMLAASGTPSAWPRRSCFRARRRRHRARVPCPNYQSSSGNFACWIKTRGNRAQTGGKHSENS